MQSKEEIEKAKENFNFFNEGDYITKEMVNSKEIMFGYIKQLELDRQKLIEKLEETRNNLEKDGFVGYADEIQKAIEILKGENDE